MEIIPSVFCVKMFVKVDPADAKLLNRIHYGILTPEDGNILKSHFIDIASNDGSMLYI